MIRVSQSWVIFSIFTTTWRNFMKLVMIHHWDKTPDCLFRVARAIACKFWTCRSKRGPKNRLLEEENEYLHQLLVGKCWDISNELPTALPWKSIVLEVEPFVPSSVTRTMQFVMLVPRHSTMSVVAGSAEWWESSNSTQWWGVHVRIENMVVGCILLLSGSWNTFQPLVCSELPNKI